MMCCAGHFGYIKLALPAYHIGFFKHILNVLQVICKYIIIIIYLYDYYVFSSRVVLGAVNTLLAFIAQLGTILYLFRFSCYMPYALWVVLQVLSVVDTKKIQKMKKGWRIFSNNDSYEILLRF